MRWFRARALLVLMAMGGAHMPAGGQGTPDPGKAPPKTVPFKVEFVIHPVVADLPPPDFYGEIVTEQMAISSKSEAAQKHVLQGIALIHAAWDFEAYRHFCEAVKLDPDCLMAYWGIGLALAAPNNEFAVQRMAAVDRMLDLLEAHGKDLPKMEQEYALCLALLFSSAAGQAADAFQELAERYPKNLLAGLLATYLQRDGYTEFGDPLYGQECAIARMRQYLVAHPDNLTVLEFWAMLHTEAPDADGNLRKEVLPYVRKIVRLWIESGAAFTGTYAVFNHSENAVATPLIVSKSELGKPVGPIVEKRCLACHGSVANLGRRGKQQRDDKWSNSKPPAWLNYPLYCWNLYNLSYPEKSMILRASLSKDAGGYEWCKAKDGGPAAAFRDTKDPDYQAILRAIRAAKVRQQEHGRPDLPGFRPGDYYIRWMKRFGILPESFDPSKDPIDAYETDRAYWRSLWHQPVNSEVTSTMGAPNTPRD